MGLAAMAGCAIVMASACGAHSAAGNVRATAHVSTSRAAPAAAPHIAKYPRCRAAQLSARLGDIGMGAGSSWQYVVLTNKGGGPCALNGDPVKLMGVRPDGTKKALAHISPDDPRTLSLTGPASLRPGQQLLYVRPLTEGANNWKAPWTSLIRRRSAQWGQILQDDVDRGVLKTVAVAPHNYRGASILAYSAVLYQKAS